MRPSAFVFLDAIPLNPNGKVNRRALPAPDGTRPELEEAFVMPRTPVEEAIAAIWRELLGVEKVGINDNFFDLGGHSLLAAQVSSRIGERFKVKLPLRRLFEATTIKDLAELIDTFSWSASNKEAVSDSSDQDRDEIII
jgi:acyl carrier protein